MKVFDILLEYNVSRMVHDFGTELVKRYESEFKKLLTPEEIIEKLGNYDPSSKKIYTFWIVGNYTRKGIPRWDDLGKVKESLELFDKLKNLKKIPTESRDINRYKSLSDLMDLCDEFIDKPVESNNEEERRYEKELFSHGDATLLYNDNKIKVIRPHNVEASCFFGRQTRWCTAAKKQMNFIII